MSSRATGCALNSLQQVGQGIPVLQDLRDQAGL